jgi:NADP-dependent 3-hydroxy acid dehydrogenase YdfG
VWKERAIYAGEWRYEVVVVTGASAGVGRVTARQFGKRGAKVTLLAKGTEGLEAAKRESKHTIQGSLSP